MKLDVAIVQQEETEAPPPKPFGGLFGGAKRAAEAAAEEATEQPSSPFAGLLGGTRKVTAKAQQNAPKASGAASRMGKRAAREAASAGAGQPTISPKPLVHKAACCAKCLLCGACGPHEHGGRQLQVPESPCIPPGCADWRCDCGRCGGGGEEEPLRETVRGRCQKGGSRCSRAGIPGVPQTPMALS